MNTMELHLPAWFKYRQGQVTAAGDKCFKLTVPVIGDAYGRVRQQDGRWQTGVGLSADGSDCEWTEPKFESEAAAWRAAFDLYRSVVIY